MHVQLHSQELALSTITAALVVVVVVVVVVVRAVVTRVVRKGEWNDGSEE